MAKDMLCRLLFLWFEGNQVIRQLTATSVWCHLFLRASRRKRSGQLCIRIYHMLSVQFRTAKEFPFPNLGKKLPSIQTLRTKASRTRVFLSLRRLLNHTSPTVGNLCYSHTFSHRSNWTILFAICSCRRANQYYWDQDKNGIFLRKMAIDWTGLSSLSSPKPHRGGIGRFFRMPLRKHRDEAGRVSL